MEKTEDRSTRCGIVLLAAGSSSRMGKPKQLLDFNGSTLLSHIIDVSSTVRDASLVVVTGANSKLLEDDLENKRVYVARNTNWTEGIASSIRCGLNALDEIDPSYEFTLFLTGDQPFVTTALLNSLIDKYKETGKPIVACSYAGSLGIPAIFHKSLVPELKALIGDTGAKSIILNNITMVAQVEFPLGTIDIDTEADYTALKKEVTL